MKPITPDQMAQYCLRLGLNLAREVPPDCWDPLPAWRKLQQKAKASYLALIQDHHPDRGGDPELAKRLTEAYNAIKSTTPIAPQRPRRVEWPPPIATIRIRFDEDWPSSTTSGTWTSGIDGF